MSRPRRHLIADRHAEIAAGLVLFALGAVLLHDAWDGRGRRVPWPMGAVMPW